MAAESIGIAPRRSSSWTRRYPPMAALMVAIFIGAAVLPSALNVQQPNPNETAEYAPVPPQDDTPPPSTSFSSLGLTTGGGGGPAAEAPVVRLPNAPKIKKPQTKQCVQHPDGLKQTEDPNSPPCVPFFDGDNGGKTWQGVTEDEITVLMYISTYIGYATESGDAEAETSPDPGGYCDVNRPSDEPDQACTDPNTGIENSNVRVLKALSRYFNDRFQTYGRKIHFHLYWSTGAQTPSSRRAEAADNWERLKPFAVIDNAFFGGFNDIYGTAMARRNVSVYGSFAALRNDHFRNNAPFIWSFWPDIEHWADQYTTYLCQRVAPKTTVQFPGTSDRGQPLPGKERRYGLLYTSDESYPGLHYFRALVEEGIKNCPNGAKFNIVDRQTFPYAGYGSTNAAQDSHTYAPEVVASFQKNNVTTVLWFAGMEGKITPAADQAEYYPEWIVAGDLVIDNIANGRDQNQDVWRNAVVVSNYLREGDQSEVPGRRAYRESEPNGRPVDESSANSIYRPLFMLYKAIQVAGPNLTPESVDKGQHAIPRQKSTSPYVAACFYDPGDFTCVKDATLQWWDPNAPDPNGGTTDRGCWRMVNEGNRVLAGGWMELSEPFTNPNDPCNGVVGTNYGNLNP